LAPRAAVMYSSLCRVSSRPRAGMAEQKYASSRTPLQAARLGARAAAMLRHRRRGASCPEDRKNDPRCGVFLFHHTGNYLLLSGVWTAAISALAGALESGPR
jgi:hypothetical protein